MLTLEQIKKSYPVNLHRFPRFILREYLQHKVLEVIYNSVNPGSLCFIGGTCLRIVHQNRRFSEDLDFDNLNMTHEQFENLASEIELNLSKNGYETELKMVMKGAWHCYIRFPGLLFDEGLSGHRNEKILIQLDTESQQFHFEPEVYMLNRFDVFASVLTTPLPVLMAQKCFAIINRKRNKGRDFYDLVFLMGLNVKPDYAYLEAKLSITNAENLKNALLARCAAIDMREMASDVEPFLFEPGEVNRVINFEAIARQYPF
ncbi:MAG: nucleotidyl transferase AbiEii/AbiGii toxin family protein [Candidatus Cyclonatronum sp.]|uniref:nucleotidyl transferase AbiEii/AbiGii toxin family protein n=1 Tax=Cyclonatronum sp. TaxID=3024185 RepID=UPI0025B90883|nr:nucleotidyl transferase AbiEii/AbiGii toxin family protein [Cyclonatronum sp.]MCH8488101.1 nucleotidyl transferase AbiEii/AbiGii toxin family protein [Cyclonatronum sp.]